MKTLKLFSAIIALCLITLNVNAQKKIKGSGASVTQSFDIDNFSSIGLGISADVHLSQGNRYSVEVKGQQNIINHLDLDKRGSTLSIGMDNNYKYYSYDKLDIYITMPDLESLSLGGSGSIIGETKFGDLGDLSINIGGSGSVFLDIDSEDVKANIGGSGSIKLEGTCDYLSANIAGSGSVKAADLEANKARVVSAGSGSLVIHVTDELDATITGSGGVKYKGNPKVNSKVMGSGRIRSY